MQCAGIPKLRGFTNRSGTNTKESTRRHSGIRDDLNQPANPHTHGLAHKGALIKVSPR